MPGLDRTGPNGKGPKTGWAMGKCNPETRDQLDDLDIVPGRRRRLGEGWKTEERRGGRGKGRGYGMRHRHGNGRDRGMGRGYGYGRGRGMDHDQDL
ncbi:MAG TPA: DUF5320 domain-containing protein [Bacteroidales bacterium]|nr:DUF5320 domain-containing protein [Bacteroidales bacterium]